MNLRRSFLSAALVSLLFSSPARATTTLYKFCADSNDNSTYESNTNAAVTAGWVLSNFGAKGSSNDGTYSSPSRFNTGTKAESPSCTDGSYINSIVIGVRATAAALERKITVQPLFENGNTGASREISISNAGSLQNVSFEFSTTDKIVSFVLSIPGSGGVFYVYDVLVKTYILVNTPANLALSGTAGANDFDVTWSSVANAEGYSVKLLDTNGGVVSSNDVAAATTSASFTGLTSSTAYTVVVVALGNHAITDDSVAATLAVTTAASAIAAPTLVVADKNWTAGVAGTSAVSATLEGDVACTIESVSMSDGSTATVANGILSWTPPLSAAASTVTATFHVTHGSDGWDVSDTLSVAATPAPAAPVVLFDNVTSRSFDASWSVSGGGPVSSYKLRAWTGRATPDNPTGGTNENFATYAAGGTVPAGWVFKNSHEQYSNYSDAPVDFKGGSSQVDYWIATPDFGGTISSFSFHLRKVSGTPAGTFTVYGSTGSTNQTDWVSIKTLTDAEITTGNYSVDKFENGDSLVSAGFTRLFFRTVKNAGNFGFGTFSVSGTDWPAADFLEGWGGAKVSVGSAASQTFSDPVPGELNYVEVTAVGPAGATTSTIASVAVPGRPSVISVK